MLGPSSAHPALLALLASLLASLVRGDDGLSDSGQAPIVSSDRVRPGRNATIKFPCAKPRGETQESVSIASEVCISWSSSDLDKDVLIEHPGLCPGTLQTPYIAVYSTPDCTGEHKHPGWYSTDRDGRPRSMTMPHCLSHALWPVSQATTAKEESRSMILRCGDQGGQGADEVHAIRRPIATSEATPSPKGPQQYTGSISDSACYVRELGEVPRFLVHHVEADLCMNIQPKRQLKVYHTAKCANGTQALFARFAGADCRGTPGLLTAVAGDMFTKNGQPACIDMDNANGRSSYAFWCTGELQTGQKPKDELFPDKGDDQVRIHACFGSACERPKESDSVTARPTNTVKRLLFFIGLFILPVLSLVLLWFFIAAAVNESFTNLFQRIKGRFQRDGAVALK